MSRVKDQLIADVAREILLSRISKGSCLSSEVAQIVALDPDTFEAAIEKVKWVDRTVAELATQQALHFVNALEKATQGKTGVAAKGL